MSDFSTTYGAHDVLILGEAHPVLGTAMLGDDFGVIKRATLVRSGKRVEITDDAQSLRILLITNPGFEMTLECCFDLSVTAPGFLEEFALPMVGVVGRVMEGVSVMWEEGSERMLSIPVAAWDSMAGAAAYRLDADGDLYEISADSPLLRMNANYVNNLNKLDITGLTGGTSADLDGVPTVNVALNLKAELSLLLAGVWQTKEFMLVTLTTAQSMTGGDGSENADPATGTLVIHPDDFDGMTNDKIWIETN